MACRPEPDFPAVMIALEHLKELNLQLEEDRIPFFHEASLHLTEITAAVTELEADRRAAHQHLEVETIENSKLRHHINSITEKMSKEIMCDAAAARASNAEEMESLQKELISVSQLREAATLRQETLRSQNQALYPEREQVKVEHGEIVAALNDQITVKYGLQMQLDQKRGQIKELRSRTAAVRQSIITSQQNMVLERELFAMKRDSLSKEKDRIDGEVKQLEQVIGRIKGELHRVRSKKQEINDHLGELKIRVAKLESNLQTQTTSWCQCLEQLEVETVKHQEMKQQRGTLKSELRALREEFSVKSRRLQEEISTFECKIEEQQALRCLCQDSLAQSHEMFKHQRDEEDEVRAEHFCVSQKLKQSKLQLEEHIASIVKHRTEIKKMNKQIAALQEAETINKRVFVINREEMNMSVNTEKGNIIHFEEEKRRLKILLDEARKSQEEHMLKMTSDINIAKRRYQELQQEEALLQQQHPASTDANLLMSYMSQCEIEYREKENKVHQEIEQCTSETVSITGTIEEKQRKVEEKEERLKELQATWREEQSRHQRLEMQTSELKRKKSNLELSIQDLKERTSALFAPKEGMKSELEELREHYMEVLDKQASELRAAEISIYNSRVKLEQVGVENSRMELRVRQMTDDAGRAREDKDRYRHEGLQVRRDVQALLDCLHKGWRQDNLLTRENQSRASRLLDLMSADMNCLNSRTQHLENISTLLRQLMLDFSKQLGYQNK
ncbi:coiled-coil domain-containing protein 175 [Antennarius striatus]|uniref:coiled-coil domain-containing protein 175 n=1 Tax=Antennarius striatus TaxID=241820 RepID=UPI0035B399AC